MDKKLRNFYILVIITTIISFSVFYCSRVLKIKHPLINRFSKCTKCNKERQTVLQMFCSDYNRTYFYIAMHFSMFFVTGLLFPGYTDRIVLISIIYELLEASTDYVSGCWQDVGTNTLAYILGSYLVSTN